MGQHHSSLEDVFVVWPEKAQDLAASKLELWTYMKSFFKTQTYLMLKFETLDEFVDNHSLEFANVLKIPFFFDGGNRPTGSWTFRRNTVFSFHQEPWWKFDPQTQKWKPQDAQIDNVNANRYRFPYYYPFETVEEASIYEAYLTQLKSLYVALKQSTNASQTVATDWMNAPPDRYFVLFPRMLAQYLAKDPVLVEFIFADTTRRGLFFDMLNELDKLYSALKVPDSFHSPLYVWNIKTEDTNNTRQKGAMEGIVRTTVMNILINSKLEKKVIDRERYESLHAVPYFTSFNTENLMAVYSFMQDALLGSSWDFVFGNIIRFQTVKKLVYFITVSILVVFFWPVISVLMQIVGNLFTLTYYIGNGVMSLGSKRNNYTSKPTNIGAVLPTTRPISNAVVRAAPVARTTTRKPPPAPKPQPAPTAKKKKLTNIGVQTDPIFIPDSDSTMTSNGVTVALDANQQGNPEIMQAVNNLLDAAHVSDEENDIVHPNVAPIVAPLPSRITPLSEIDDGGIGVGPFSANNNNRSNNLNQSRSFLAPPTATMSISNLIDTLPSVANPHPEFLPRSPIMVDNDSDTNLHRSNRRTVRVKHSDAPVSMSTIMDWNNSYS